MGGLHSNGSEPRGSRGSTRSGAAAGAARAPRRAAHAWAHLQSEPVLAHAAAATARRSVTEHHGRPIFCLSFNRLDPTYKDLLATVGKNRVRPHGPGNAGRVCPVPHVAAARFPPSP
jgi:phage tail sheath gpL-like